MPRNARLAPRGVHNLHGFTVTNDALFVSSFMRCLLSPIDKLPYRAGQTCTYFSCKVYHTFKSCKTDFALMIVVTETNTKFVSKRAFFDSTDKKIYVLFYKKMR